jgi:hypothetical protein
MSVDRLVNQRVKEIMAVSGYEDNIHGFAVDILKWQRSDKLSNVFKGKNVASTAILQEITNKVVNKNGEKINGHWLLAGEGSMFFDKKGTAATNIDEAAVSNDVEDLKKLLEKALDNNEALIRTNNMQAEAIRNFSIGKVVEQG